MIHELEHVGALAKAATARLEAAKVSGSPSAIAAAKQDAELLIRKRESTNHVGNAYAEMIKALGAPINLGFRR